MKQLLVTLFLLIGLVALAQTFSRTLAFRGAAVQKVVANGGDGPNVWYWSKALGDAAYSLLNVVLGPGYSYGSIVTNEVAGNCTKLAVKCYSQGDSLTMKIALYDMAGDLVAGTSSDTVTVLEDETAVGAWYEVVLNTPAVVAANVTYFVACSGSTENLVIKYDNATSFSVTNYVLHADFPSATISTTLVDRCYGVKMYVD